MKYDALVKQLLGNEATISSPLYGGMMNESYIVDKGKDKFVLYIPTAQANEMVDRAFEKYNQKLVFDINLTSKNIYFDISSGIKINEYIKGSSLNKVQNYNSKKIAALLKTMHSKAPLTYKDYNPFEKLNEYELERQSLCEIDEDEYSLLKNCVYSQIDFLKQEKLCLSHNDFQRSNIIQTEEDDYYVIDFEFMSNNYETYDLACFANDNIEDGLALLNEYFSNTTLEQKKRFYLWRIYISLQWYNVALIKHYRGEGRTHNIDFLAVGKHFIKIAKDCHLEIKKLG